MGDGMYIFNTEPGMDNALYDLIDRYVLDALDQIQVGSDNVCFSIIYIAIIYLKLKRTCYWK